jgi:hypothetical protein
LCGEHKKKLYTVYLTRFRTYKIALPPQTKTQERRGPQTDQHLPPSPFTGKFLRKADIYDWNLLVIWSMVERFELETIFKLFSVRMDLKNLFQY